MRQKKNVIHYLLKNLVFLFLGFVSLVFYSLIFHRIHTKNMAKVTHVVEYQGAKGGAIFYTRGY